MPDRPEVARLRAEIRDFAEHAIPSPLREKIAAGAHLDKADTVAWMKLMQQRDWATAQWPEEYGGLGWNVLQRFVLDDELARLGLPRLVPFGVKYAGPVLYTFGSEWQKQRFLPAIRTTDEWWAQGYSEPGSGSDLASLRTRAERRGDHFVVNGQKTWTTMAQWADWIFCLVRTSTEARKQAGISFLLIDLKSPGVDVRPIASMDGSRHLNEVWFDDVVVPAENLVGEEGDGWTIAKFLLQNERTSGFFVGLPNRALRRLRERASDRPELRDRLAALELRYLAFELAAYQAVIAMLESTEDGGEAALIKLRGTELHQDILQALLDADGISAMAFVPSAGATPGIVGEFLQYRAATIYGGTSEIQRGIIAKAVYGL
jgi:alkylation response protein AidB-like acyl-CoA dehydrogenase